MGEQKRKSDISGISVQLSATAPKYLIKSDEDKRDEMAARITWNTISAVISAKYPNGDREERKHIRVWQELIFSGEEECAVIWGEVDWLLDIMREKGLRVDSSFSHAMAALEDYLDTLAPNAPEAASP